MKRQQTVTAASAVMRHGDEIPVKITGTYIPAVPGDREQPYEPAYFVDITATDQEGNEIEMTEDEEDEFAEKLFESMR